MISRFPALIYGIILFFAAFFIACSVEEYSDISVYDARLNAEVNPTGVDTEKPNYGTIPLEFRTGKDHRLKKIVT
ncbi:MAG TPA: hypothetical protein DC042_13995 [Bacteroidales bacterium]|nr:hypothetical protein [Bacteroidales bacterium]